MLCRFDPCEYYRCAVEKSAAESRVKELEDMLAASDAEAKKVAESAAAREEQHVDRLAFHARNVRG